MAKGLGGGSRDPDDTAISPTQSIPKWLSQWGESWGPGAQPLPRGSCPPAPTLVTVASLHLEEGKLFTFHFNTKKGHQVPRKMGRDLVALLSFSIRTSCVAGPAFWPQGKHCSSQHQGALVHFCPIPWGLRAGSVPVTTLAGKRLSRPQPSFLPAPRGTIFPNKMGPCAGSLREGKQEQQRLGPVWLPSDLTNCPSGDMALFLQHTSTWEHLGTFGSSSLDLRSWESPSSLNP